MNKNELAALCELLMVSDPWPLSKTAQEVLEHFADTAARQHGYEDWIDAYHDRRCLGKALFENMLNKVVDDLDILSTHTYITGVHDVYEESVEFLETGLRVKGEGSVDVSLHYGSMSEDPETDDFCMSFPFQFTVVLDQHGAVTKREMLEVDTSSFYEEDDELDEGEGEEPDEEHLPEGDET